MGPASEGTVVDRNPSRGPISITEWAREAEEGTTHEVWVEWDADSNSED
jgi:membrane protein